MNGKNGTLLENNKLLLGILILAPFLLYVKALSFDFSPMDEQWLIVKNVPFLEKWASIHDIFTRPTAGFYYRPLFVLTVMIDYHLAGLSPLFYHLSNLLFHIACVLLLFRLLLAYGSEKATAFFCALVFALHPLMLHSVAWIPGRNDLLLCLFTLSSLLLLHRYVQDRKGIYLLLHLLFFICALLTKENAVVLPFIFIAACGVFYKGQIRNPILLSIAWILIAFSWFFLRKSVIDFLPPLGADLLTSVKNFFSAMLLFTGKAVIPVQQSVFPTLQNTSILPGLVASLIILLLCFKPGFKNNRAGLFGLFLFFGVLAIPVWFGATNTSGEHYEHRIYTSMAGLFIFISQLRLNTSSALLRYATFALLIAFSVKTFLRMDIYKDSFSFAESGAKEAPNYYLFHSQLGDIYFDRQNYKEALDDYSKAIVLRPDLASLYNNRGLTLSQLGRYPEALEDFTKAVSSSTHDPSVLLNRCMTYMYAGQPENAAKDLAVLKKCCAAVIPPGLEDQVNKAWNGEMMKQINEEILKDPTNALFYNVRGKLLYRSGEKEKAILDLKKACELDPSNAVYKQNLEQAQM